MQRVYLFCSLFLFTQCKTSSDKQGQTIGDAPKPRHAYDYCYANKRGLFVFNAGDSAGRHIELDGNGAQLSPDGTWLAYTHLDPTGGGRRIGLMDLETGKTRILDSACSNCYGPVWSPDGKYLAYNAITGNQWGIKYVDTGDTHADFLAKPHELMGYFSPSWSADSKKVIMQDMTAVYIVDLNGTVLRTIPFADIDTAILGSSSMEFLLTKNEDKLIYGSEVSTDTTTVPGSDEPPGYIFSYDINSKKVTRLTLGKYSCYQPVLKGDTIFCHGYDPQGGPNDMGIIYKMNIDGGEFGVAFKNGEDFSCRTKP